MDDLTVLSLQASNWQALGLQALGLQLAWGADEALDDDAIDRTRPAAPASPLLTPTASRAPVRAELPAIRAPLATRAHETARHAATPAALRAALADFTDCPLAATATSLVFSDGNPQAPIVMVGDVPGPEEDVTGTPFAGAAGGLLDRMLGSIGLDRQRVLLTMLVPWRPPGGRAPTETEIAVCLPFLLRHLVLLRPKLIVAFGTLPARALTQRSDTIRRLRGRWIDVEFEGGGPVPVLPMLHPSTILQTPALKREAWTDLLALRLRIDKIGDMT